MSEIGILVFGSRDCVPCERLKRDIDSMGDDMDIDFTYIDVDVKEVPEMKESEIVVFKKMVERYGTATVPMIHIETGCGVDDDIGYSGLDNLLEKIMNIRCDVEVEK